MPSRPSSHLFRITKIKYEPVFCGFRFCSAEGSSFGMAMTPIVLDNSAANFFENMETSLPPPPSLLLDATLVKDRFLFFLLRNLSMFPFRRGFSEGKTKTDIRLLQRHSREGTRRLYLPFDTHTRRLCLPRSS